MLFDRLAVCREAFEKIAELNQDCAPELKHIMASRNKNEMSIREAVGRAS